MTTKADFNAEEWARLVEAPLLAAMLAAAERGGTIRESVAVARSYAEARRHRDESALLDAMVASPPTLDPNRLREGGDVTALAGRRLAEAVAVLDA